MESIWTWVQDNKWYIIWFFAGWAVAGHLYN